MPTINPKTWTAFALCLLTSTVSLLAQEEMPTTWTNAQGAQIEAEFVRLTEDGVVLRLKSNGREAEVAFSSLSLDSHLQAIKLGHPEEFSKPLISTATENAEPNVPPPTPIDINYVQRSPFANGQTIDQFLDITQREIAAGNYFVLWHTLPEKMQGSIEDLIVKGMEKVGTAPIVQLRTLLKSVNNVMTEKEEFVFALPEVADNPEVLAELKAQWPLLQQISASMSDPTLWQKENFQKANVSRWLAAFLSALGSNQDAVLATIDRQSGVPGMGATMMPSYTVTKSSANSADVTITLPPPTPPMQLTFSRAGGIWIPPKEMSVLRRAVDAGLAQMDKVDGRQVQAGIQASLGAAIPLVGSLERAANQEEFNEAVAQLKTILEGLGATMPGGMVGAAGGAPSL